MTEVLSTQGKPEDPAVATEVTIVEPARIGAPEGGKKAARSGRARLKALTGLLYDLVVAAVVCVFIITYVVQAFKVQGTSMAPLLVDGERILVNKFVYRFRPIARGDVAVFWYPEDPELSFIKRVVGLPGDQVEIIEGRVFVNGEPLVEPYVAAQNADRRSYPSREVRSGHYYVLGDNRQGSNDSRSWGLVPYRYIYGRAFLRIWPLGDFGLIE